MEDKPEIKDRNNVKVWVEVMGYVWLKSMAFLLVSLVRWFINKIVALRNNRIAKLFYKDIDINQKNN